MPADMATVVMTIGRARSRQADHHAQAAERGLIELEASGSSPSMQNISQADILNLPMDLPDVDEQHRIVAYLDEQTARIDILIAETERFIELARERRSALITAAVTGQIDVRSEVA